MDEMDPTSARAQFNNVTTPGTVAPIYVNNVNHLPSPSTVLDLDTPRTVEMVQGDGIPTGAWASGLFDCLDNLVPNCCMLTFCPCVALAQLSTRLGVASYRVVLSVLLFLMAVELSMVALIWTSPDVNDDHSLNDNHGTIVNDVLAILTLVVLFTYIWQLRTKTRMQFQLPGNAVTDCLSSFFFPWCTVAQLRTHVRCYKPGSCSFRAPDVLQAYPGKSYAV